MSSSKAYPGSCHCGNVQYLVKLTFPPVLSESAESIRIYKCNCTTCQKMGFFHCRPIKPAEDFVLTSPATIEELGDYRTATKKQGWYFCKKCGVRILGLGGKWRQVELDVQHWAENIEEKEGGKLQKVWMTEPSTVTTTENGKEESKSFHYVSVNAVTLEPQGEVDLVKWHENGWVFYVENLVRADGSQRRLKPPYEGGMY